MRYRLYMRRQVLCVFLLCLFCSGRAEVRDGAKIVVSDNGRYLQYSDGTPFFYLGDTAWELFHRLNREEADLYLEDRAKKGYTVIQAVALSELDGHVVPNPYGFLPLTGLDPSRPALREGSDNDYWDHVDYVVNKANALGMFIGLLPTWGRYWHDGKPLFDKENAERYGEFIGRRYKDADIIWILGGDRNPDSHEKKEIIRAMARGLKTGDGGRHLITYHPAGWSGSAQWFHDETWLDFNMRQNGHEVLYSRRYSSTLDDYNRHPVKPIIDGEPVYEDHPVCFNPEEMGHTVSADVRRAMYWDLFNGACGHTYGHHSVWQMYDPEKETGSINNPLMSWKDALRQPGAEQMMYGRQLIESRPFFSRIPDVTVIVPDKVQTSVPGEGLYRFSATRDEEGTYIMIYVPTGRTFSVRTDIIRGNKIKAWWYNPRNGKAKKIGVFRNTGQKAFISPTPGEMIDWILVLDDVSSKYPAPGKRWK